MAHQTSQDSLSKGHRVVLACGSALRRIVVHFCVRKDGMVFTCLASVKPNPTTYRLQTDSVGFLFTDCIARSSFWLLCVTEPISNWNVRKLEKSIPKTFLSLKNICLLYLSSWIEIIYLKLTVLWVTLGYSEVKLKHKFATVFKYGELKMPFIKIHIFSNHIILLVPFTATNRETLGLRYCGRLLTYILQPPLCHLYVKESGHWRKKAWELSMNWRKRNELRERNT